MSLSYFDSNRVAAGPLTAACGMRIHDVSASPGQVTLAAGVYEIFNDGDHMAYLRLGAAVSVPSDGGPEVSGQGFVPPGGTLSLAVGSSTALHSLALDSTQLVIVRKELR